LQANKQNVRYFKGYPQGHRLIRSTERPITDAKRILFETLEDLYKSGWAKTYADRQDWLLEEKKRLWALREARNEEKKGFEMRRRQARDNHWLAIKHERSMLKAKIAAKNQTEFQKRNEILHQSRIEFLKALNEESTDFLRNPEEAVNRRFLTFGYKRWMNWKN
jgi:hypothetical protein